MVRMVSCNHESLTLDYGRLSYSGDDVMIGGRYCGACDYLQAHAFMESDIMRGEARVHFSSNPVAKGLLLQIPKEELTTTISERMLLQIVAVDENGTICSDVISQNTFYHFVMTGIANDCIV